jgi:hypothetical protein
MTSSLVPTSGRLFIYTSSGYFQQQDAVLLLLLPNCAAHAEIFTFSLFQMVKS